MGRAWLQAILLGSVAGCYSPDTLENAPCETDEDCLRGYRCIKTLHQQAMSLAGWCRNDELCAEGEQEGCLTTEDGECPRADLTPVSDPMSGNTFCCRTNDSIDPWIHIVSSDFSSALCGTCPSDLCPQDRVLCRTGEPRCQLVEGLCGCRTPDAQIENAECASDQTCGEGFSCTRTLEQEAEPLEETQRSGARAGMVPAAGVARVCRRPARGLPDRCRLSWLGGADVHGRRPVLLLRRPV